MKKSQYWHRALEDGLGVVCPSNISFYRYTYFQIATMPVIAAHIYGRSFKGKQQQPIVDRTLDWVRTVSTVTSGGNRLVCNHTGTVRELLEDARVRGRLVCGTHAAVLIPARGSRRQEGRGENRRYLYLGYVYIFVLYRRKRICSYHPPGTGRKGYGTIRYGYIYWYGKERYGSYLLRRR